MTGVQTCALPIYWDEHPWCTWCYVATDIAECDEKQCYLCRIMTETQLKERKVARKKWKNKRAKGKSMSARTDGKLNRGIGNQIHADILNTKENDFNPRIDDIDREHAFRYCRPGTSLPMLASEIELKLYDDKKIERELIHQRDSFLLEYSKERKRRVKKNEES